MGLLHPNLHYLPVLPSSPYLYQHHLNAHLVQATSVHAAASPVDAGEYPAVVKRLREWERLMLEQERQLSMIGIIVIMEEIWLGRKRRGS